MVGNQLPAECEASNLASIPPHTTISAAPCEWAWQYFVQDVTLYFLRLGSPHPPIKEKLNDHHLISFNLLFCHSESYIGRTTYKRTAAWNCWWLLWRKASIVPMAFIKLDQLINVDVCWTGWYIPTTKPIKHTPLNWITHLKKAFFNNSNEVSSR